MSEFPVVLPDAVNPVTRTVVQFKPPVKLESAEAQARFIDDFTTYCQAAWVFARLDPDEVTLFGGKVAGMPGEPTTAWPAIKVAA